MGNRRDDLTLSIPRTSLPSSSSLPSLASQSSIQSGHEELKTMPLDPPKVKAKKRLSKQLSLLSETYLDKAWEKRRRQMMILKERKQKQMENGEQTDLTDGDLRELKGCIELGFGFDEEDGQNLCNTIPALDLYFAVNRHMPPVPPPRHGGSSSSFSHSNVSGSGPPSSLGSPKSDSDSLKLLPPGANPQQVKARLRHWAQAVACSVKQSH